MRPNSKWVLCGLLLILASNFTFGKGFRAAKPYFTANSLVQSAVADVDGDGKLDLISISNPPSGAGGSASINVRLRTSGGDYSVNIATSTTGANLSSLVVGDFNSDHILDVAVTDSVANTLSIYAGKGDGTFTLLDSATTGTKPISVLAQNVAGHERKELLILNATDHTISVFAVDGSGSLTAGATFDAGVSQPMAFAAADLDNNGTIDVAVAGWGNNYSVMRGNGDGTFQLPITQTLPNTANPRSIAVGDLNGDGKPDLVFATGDVAVLPGNGDMLFQPPAIYKVGTDFVAVGDVNGDGNADVIALAGYANSVNVFLNDGTGTLSAPTRYSTGSDPVDALIADLDNDGHNDVAVTCSNNGSPLGEVDLMFGFGNGALSAAYSFSVDLDATSGAALAVTAGDFDGDGLSDVAVTDAAKRIIVLKNQGEHKFTPTNVILLDEMAQDIRTIDLNRDGILDLVVLQFSEYTVFVGAGDGSFHAMPPVSLPPVVGVANGAHRMAVGDLTRDGNVDLVVTNVGSTYSDIAIYTGNGDGTFGALFITTVGSGPGGAVITDLNGDGAMDLAVANGGNATVFLNDGSGKLKPAVVYPGWGSAGHVGSIATGDVDGDKNVDLIMTADGPSNTTYLSLLAGDGTGAFSRKTFATFQGLPGTLALADFNGDGLADLAVTDRQSLNVYYNGELGLFGSVTILAGGYQVSSMVAADFNNTGAPDLVTVSGSDLVTVLPNSGATRLTAATSPNPSTYGQTVTLNTMLSASVANIPAPTGTLAIIDGGDNLADMELADATFSTNSLAAGTHSLAIKYSGDSSFDPHTLALEHVVQKAKTALDVLVSNVLVGEPVNFLVTVLPEHSGVPTGPLNLSDGTTQASMSLDANGQGHVSLDGVAAGPHSFTVNYPGDSNFSASQSTMNVDVLNPTTLTLSGSSPTTTFGNNLTLTATLSSPGGNPDGTILFYDGSQVLNTVTLDAAGTASFVVAKPSGGQHTFKAEYAGTHYYTAATSTSLSHTVTPASTQVHLKASVSSVGAGYPVTLTATVDPQYGTTATGTVTFSAGSSQLGTSNLNGNGVATITTTALPVGNVSVTSSYSGDANIATALSSAVSVTVTPDFTVAQSANSQTISAGQSASFNLDLKAFGGFNGPLTFQCSGLPALATCTFNPASVSLASQTSVTVTIATAGTFASAWPTQQLPRRGTGLLAMCTGGLFGIVLVAGTTRRKAAILCGLPAILLLVSMTACGGGGGSSSPTPQPKPSTPSGVSQVTVNVSGTQNGTPVTHQVQFTLTVR